MKSIKTLLLPFLFTLIVQASFAQSWQLVWADEFTDGIGPDWVFETGNGTDGWGNRELEYYRRENATVENGKLVITAKHESFGGYNYTSVRMKTAGKKSWKYGKIEASIAMPSFQGVWPAFWMLGENGLTWPACGEIDVMEHINTGNTIYGTPHWSAPDGSYASYGGNTVASSSITNYHTYTVEWNANSIKWFLDGVQYHVMDITNGVNGTSEFHTNFFILLNMAIGGNWPGFTVDNNAFPAKMYVEYVRVYQQGNGGNNGDVIEAENFSSQSGVQTEACSDTNGGLNVGYIDTGDWMAYSNVTIPATGQYTVQYRVASQSGGGHLSLDLNAGATVLGGLDIPSTGGWQTWTTISHTVTIPAGTHSLGVFATTGGWNLNWIKITPVYSGTTIQAESYANMLGVQTEACTDTDGGLNVGYIDAGDWMAYSNVTIPATGTYKVEYRVASQSGGGHLSLDLNAGSTVLGGLDIPSTGGWQTWTTISHNVTIPAGTHSLGIYATTGGWNLNWIRITQVSTARTAGTARAETLAGSEETLSSGFRMYPNPVSTQLTIAAPEEFAGGAVNMFNTDGRVVLQTVLSNRSIDVAHLPKGLYLIQVSKGQKKFSQRVVKE